jgi:hypothetical protein
MGRAMGDAVILLYHRIAELSLDPYGLAVGPAEFRTQMAYLARVYRPMRLDDLVWAAREGSLPERAVAVTFDDGYLDNLEVASPILVESSGGMCWRRCSSAPHRSLTIWRFSGPAKRSCCRR